MRASSPRKALVWPKCLFTPAITTAVSSWRSGAAAGDGVLAAMSAVAGAGIACGGPGRVADFDGHRHALTQPAVDLVAVDDHAQPVDQVGAQLRCFHRLRRELRARRHEADLALVGLVGRIAADAYRGARGDAAQVGFGDVCAHIHRLVEAEAVDRAMARDHAARLADPDDDRRSEEHTSELQ